MRWPDRRGIGAHLAGVCAEVCREMVLRRLLGHGDDRRNSTLVPRPFGQFEDNRLWLVRRVQLWKAANARRPVPSAVVFSIR